METPGKTVRKRTVGLPANMCLTQVTEIETVTAEGDCRHHSANCDHQSSKFTCVLCKPIFLECKPKL